MIDVSEQPSMDGVPRPARKQETGGIVLMHGLVMLGLLIAAVFFSVMAFSMGPMGPVMAVMLWIGFAMYFGVTEVVPWSVARKMRN
jgi:hypothetical protein